MNEERQNPEDRPSGPGEDTPLSSDAEVVDARPAFETDNAGDTGGHTGETEPSSPNAPSGLPEESSAETEDPSAAALEDAPANDTSANEEGNEKDDEDGEDGEEDQAPVWVPEPDKLLLSLLFASHEYLDARSLREIMGPEWDTPRLRQLVRTLNRDLESGELPFEIAETDGTFRLRTLPRYFPWTRKLFKDAAPRRLSQAALETLAIVAYKQPVTKAEIESIRGVNVDGSMKTLLDKRLIDIGRRSDALGQAFTYHTTRDFMRYFGISRVPDDLPRLSEFEGILNAQSLIPQMGPDGEVHEVARDDESADGEQLTLGMDQDN